MKCIRWVLFSFLFFLNLASFPNQSKTPLEYQIKAVFLFNFTKFIEWPSQSFENDSSAFIINVFGPDPFGSFLEQAVANEYINKHPIVVKRTNLVDEIGECHILFINSESSQLKEVFTQLSDRAILTVGDAPDFTKKGGMIRFITVNNRIKLSIDLSTAKAAGLNLNSRLLSISEIENQ